MKFYKTKLKNVYLIKPFIFKDHRGIFVETYNKIIFKKKKLNINFVQDDLSISKKNVLRGIHGDFKTWKLLSCIVGKIYFIVVNNNKESKDYKKWQSFFLDDKSKNMILLPPGFGNGYYAISKKVIFSYKQSSFYNRNSQFTIKWNNKDYKFKWPCIKPILSKRDS
jgi:dTDP-4-dehydrorhamnose 3,5-epimerase